MSRNAGILPIKSSSNEKSKMSLFGTRLQSSTTTVDYDTDLFRVSLPSNWPVYDRNGVLNANAPEPGIFTVRARIHRGASVDEIREFALTPLVRESQIAADASPQRLLSNNWEGWRQEGVKRTYWGLFRDWLLFAVAYREPVLITVVAGTSQMSAMPRLRPHMEKAVKSIILVEGIKAEL